MYIQLSITIKRFSSVTLSPSAFQIVLLAKQISPYPWNFFVQVCESRYCNQTWQNNRTTIRKRIIRFSTESWESGNSTYYRRKRSTFQYQRKPPKRPYACAPPELDQWLRSMRLRVFRGFTNPGSAHVNINSHVVSTLLIFARTNYDVFLWINLLGPFRFPFFFQFSSLRKLL